MSTIDKSLTDLKVPRGIKAIDDLASGYKAYQVLITATEKGLFDWLDEHGESTAEEISMAMKINGMFIRSFLQSLVDMGVLSAEDDRYANTSLAADFLISSKPCYQGDWVMAVSGKASKWEKLEATLKLDKPGAEEFYVGQGQEYVNAMAERSLRGELQAVAKKIVAWEGFPKAKRVLDVSGGSGLYAIALCQVNPKLEAVVFDRPGIVPYTKEYLGRYSMDGRVVIRGGDILKDDIGSGYDIVILSHVLYKYRRDFPAVFSKVSKCMNAGGLLVANHWFCSPGCGKAPGGIMELDKSLNSLGHPLCHPYEFSDSLDKSGFDVLSVTSVTSAYKPSKLLMATKGLPGQKRASKKKNSCACCE
jgi:SAM-dependent methyltransferase